MIIRKAEIESIDKIMETYATARLFMCRTGNENQWVDGYPSQELIAGNIRAGGLYVCLAEDEQLVGAFYYQVENDPTYAKIYDGAWLNDRPYGVVHRIASNGKQKGIGDACLSWCFDQCGNIRVDTHRDNIVMQRVLTRNGYRYCGIIYVANGTERLAYQKTL